VDPSSPTPLPDGGGRASAAASSGPSLDAGSTLGRHRRHRFPARPHAFKVLYSDDEHSIILRAAEVAGLRPSGYVAAAALAMAEQVHGDRHPKQADEPDEADQRRESALTPHRDRELLAELVQARLALRRYAVNVNQIAAALNSSGVAPVWLDRAVAGADRAVDRLDAVAQRLVRRLT
jgi:hypothetical protein